MFSTKRSLCGAIVLLSPAATFAQRGAPPNNIVVDVTPSHAVSSFSPFRSLGAGIDRLRGDTTDKVMTPDFIAQIQSAGWQTVSYRQNTELFAEAWHWNPNGKWSNPGAKEGYFVGDATPTEPIRHSWAAPLPHRGFTMGDGTGYSRLTDGDPGTYWKSNPYLTKAFTGEAGHPQWVTLDLGGKLEIDAIRIAWAAPFATRYRVQYWTGGAAPFCPGPARPRRQAGDRRHPHRLGRAVRDQVPRAVLDRRARSFWRARGRHLADVSTQCFLLPRSMPATLARNMGSPSASTSLSGLLVVSRFLAILLSAFRTRQPRSADTRILV